MKEVKLISGYIRAAEKKMGEFIGCGWEVIHFTASEEYVHVLFARDVPAPATPTPDTPISAAPDGQTLGERLRWLRKRRGNTLDCLAFVAGISLSYLSDLERGRTLPSLAMLSRLAEVYGISASELLRGVVLEASDESEAGRDDE